MRQRLNDNELNKALEELNGWQKVDGRSAITKTFVFDNFIDAFGWMSQVALISEKMDHHPEWMNVYKTVAVTLSTHSENGITGLDIKLAKEMENQLR